MGLLVGTAVGCFVSVNEEGRDAESSVSDEEDAYEGASAEATGKSSKICHCSQLASAHAVSPAHLYLHEFDRMRNEYSSLQSSPRSLA